MEGKKLSGVCEGARVKSLGARKEKQEGLRPQSRDVVSVTGNSRTDKASNLAEAKKLVEIEKSLQKLVKELAESYNPNGFLEVVGPCKLRTASNSEVIKKLIEMGGGNESLFGECEEEGEKAIQLFKKSVNDCYDEKVMDKVAKLFRNGGFSKIKEIAIDGEEVSLNFLVGITKDRNMIGIGEGYVE